MTTKKSNRISRTTSTIVLGFLVCGIIVLLPVFSNWNSEIPSIELTPENSSGVVPEAQHRFSAIAAVQAVNMYHYKKRKLDNEFSEEILNEYLNSLDPQKIYFLADDVKEYQSYRFYVDDFLRTGKVDLAYEIYKIFRIRVKERTEYAKSLLEYPFDFMLKEQFQHNRESAQWAVSENEYNLLWRKIVKNDFLGLKLENMATEEIKTTLTQRYDQFFSSIEKLRADDVLEVLLNAYLGLIEPHSEFFSPHNSDNLKINISQQIEGIGAMLRTENEYTVIMSVIPGGPAAQSDLIHPGDRIIAVGNPDGKGYANVIGWRISDVVDRIRGPKGSVVHLKILAKDALPGATPTTLSLVRDRVKLEEQAAKISTVEIPTENQLLKLGVVKLPTFYTNLLTENDSSHEEERSSSSDVRRHLHDLILQNVDGVVLDLRGNGGGALDEAVKLTGLFIESGPVIQIRDSSGNIVVINDEDSSIEWAGPLVVLVDRNSASASEIFASAIKDYNRGVLIGETTYGKGIIQTLWPLNRWINFDNTGNLKLTTAQYYRINGTSTQHVGVQPHILFPTDKFSNSYGERLLENSLPAHVIDAINVSPWQDSDQVVRKLPEIQQFSLSRTEANPIFDYLVDLEEFRVERSEIKSISLNENDRKTEMRRDNDARLIQINQLRGQLGLEPLRDLANDSSFVDIAGDALLEEALNVLADLITTDNDEGYREATSSIQPHAPRI